jgi:hypothetical protein
MIKLGANCMDGGAMWKVKFQLRHHNTVMPCHLPRSTTPEGGTHLQGSGESTYEIVTKKYADASGMLDPKTHLLAHLPFGHRRCPTKETNEIRGNREAWFSCGWIDCIIPAKTIPHRLAPGTPASCTNLWSGDVETIIRVIPQSRPMKTENQISRIMRSLSFIWRIIGRFWT